MPRVQQFLRGLVLRIELLCSLCLRARDAASETHPASLAVLLHVVSVTVSCFFLSHLTHRYDQVHTMHNVPVVK